MLQVLAHYGKSSIKKCIVLQIEEKLISNNLASSLFSKKTSLT